MQDRGERIKRVQFRVKELEKKRERYLLTNLSTLSVLLTLTLIGTITSMTGGGKAGSLQGFYGAMLLYEKAGGYVLASVLSFVVAVLVTVVCIRSQEKSKEKKLEEEKK